jgi:hypothetical protein
MELPQLIFVFSVHVTVELFSVTFLMIWSIPQDFMERAPVSVIGHAVLGQCCVALPQPTVRTTEMLLCPGISGTTGPSSVALIALPDKAVRAQHLQSQVIHKPKEIRNLPQWEASRLDVEPRHCTARAES